MNDTARRLSAGQRVLVVADIALVLACVGFGIAITAAFSGRMQDYVETALMCGSVPLLAVCVAVVVARAFVARGRSGLGSAALATPLAVALAGYAVVTR